MRKFLSLFLLLAILPSLSFAGSITGQITTATQGPIANGTLTLTLTQSAVLAGSSLVATTSVACYTDALGNVVGEPTPIVAPTVSTNTSSGTLAAGTYYVKFTYYDGSGESAPSVEKVIILSSQGTLLTTPPVRQPASATGWKVYIGTSSGAETLQSTQVGFTSTYQQSSSLAAGSALPSSNTTVCKVVFNDQLIPSFTGYNVSFSSSSGSLVSGFPQRWYLQGGASGTVNLSNGTPLYSGVTQYPQAIVTNPAGNGQQSINGPLNLNGFPFSAGPVTATSVNNTFEVSLKATGGDGSQGNPYTGTSGCGGLLDAFNAIPSAGATIHMKAGYYKITSPCTLTGKSFTLSAEGIDKTFIDCTTLTVSQQCLVINGSITNLTTTNGAITQGDQSFVVTSGASITQGSWLMILSTSEMWQCSNSIAQAPCTQARPYFKGEWQQVRSISGTTVTPSRPMWDSYLTGTPVQLLNPITVDISGFTMLGNTDTNNGMQCLIVQYAAESSIHDTKTQNCNDRGWEYDYSVRSSFHHNKGTEYLPTLPSGLNYGLVSMFTYSLDVHDNDITAGRHAFTTGALAIGGVTRDLRVHDNPGLRSQSTYGLDAHGITEFYYYENNTVVGGIDPGGQFGFIRNNVIFKGPNTNVLALGEFKSWNWTITGNTLVGDTSTSSTFIAGNSAVVSNDKKGHLVFDNNTIRVNPAGTITSGNIVLFDLKATDSADSIDFSGNKIRNLVTSATANTSYTSKVLVEGTVDRLTMDRNTIFGGDLDLVTNTAGVITEPVEVSGNELFHSVNYGFQLTTVSPSAINLIFSGNTLAFANCSGALLNMNTSTMPILVINNQFYNNGQDGTCGTKNGLSKTSGNALSLILAQNQSFDNQVSHTQNVGYSIIQGTGADTIEDNGGNTCANNVSQCFSKSSTSVYLHLQGQFCGTTATCATTGSTTAFPSGAFPTIQSGTVALTAGTATVTIPGYASTSTFNCIANDTTTITNASKAVPASATTITVTGTGTDVISYMCNGN